MDFDACIKVPSIPGLMEHSYEAQWCNVLELHNKKWILRLKITTDLFFIRNILSVEIIKGFEGSNTKQAKIRL